MNNLNFLLNDINHNNISQSPIPQFPVPPSPQGPQNSQRTIQVVPPGNPLGSLPIDSQALLFAAPTQAVGLPSSIGSNSLRDAIVKLLETLKSWFPHLMIPSADAILLFKPPLDGTYECELGYFPFKFIRLICESENSNSKELIIDEETNRALISLFRFLKTKVVIRNHFIEIWIVWNFLWTTGIQKKLFPMATNFTQRK